MKNKKNSLLNKQKVNTRSVTETEPVPSPDTAPVVDGHAIPSKEIGNTQWPSVGMFLKTDNTSTTIGYVDSNPESYLASDANDNITVEFNVVTCNTTKVCDPYRIVFHSNTFLTPVVQWENIDHVDGHKPLFPSYTEGMADWTSEERKSGNAKADCFIISSEEHSEILNPGKYYFDSTFIPYAELCKMFTNMTVNPDKPYKFTIIVNVTTVDDENKLHSLVDSQGQLPNTMEVERIPMTGTGVEHPGIGNEEGQSVTPDLSKGTIIQPRSFDYATSETPWDHVEYACAVETVTYPFKCKQDGAPVYTVIGDCIYAKIKMATYNESGKSDEFNVLFTTPFYLTPNVSWENIDHIEGHNRIYPIFSNNVNNSWKDEKQESGNHKADFFSIKGSEYESLKDAGLHYFDTTYLPYDVVNKLFDMSSLANQPYRLSFVVEVEAKDPATFDSSNPSPGTNLPERLPPKNEELTPPPMPPEEQVPDTDDTQKPNPDDNDPNAGEDTQKPGSGETVTPQPPTEDNTQQPSQPDQGDNGQGPTTPVVNGCQAPGGCKHKDTPSTDAKHEECLKGCGSDKGCLHPDVVHTDPVHSECQEERGCEAPRGCQHTNVPRSNPVHNECRKGCNDSKGCLYPNIVYTDAKHQECAKKRGCDSKYGCKHPNKPFDANIHSECQVETELPNPGQPGQGIIPPYQPPTGTPGTGSETVDNSSVATFTITPHTPLEMSVGTPIILQITREDKVPLTNVSITAKEGNITVTQEHEDTTLYTIKSTDPLKTEITITADGFMPATLPVEFLAVNFTVTPSKTKVREKEKFILTIEGVRDTDRVEVNSDLEGLGFVVKSNKAVEVIYLKNTLKPGEKKEVEIDVIVLGVKVSTTVTLIPEIDILTLDFKPGKETYFTEEMTLTISGTEEELNVTTTTAKVNITKVDNLNYKINVDEPTYGRINITGQHVKSEYVQVLFRDKKQLEVIPHTPLAASMEQPIMLEVVSKSGEDIPNIILRPRNNKVTVKKVKVEGHINLYEVRPIDRTKDCTDTLDISSTTDHEVEAITQDVTFSVLNISIKQNQKYFRAKKLNTLTIVGLNDIDEVTGSCELEDVTVKRVDFDTFEVVLDRDLGKFDTVKTVINFVVNGHKYGQPVEFIPELDTITFNFFPDKQVKYTSEVTVEVQGAKGQVDLKTSHPAINIRRIGELTDNRFLVDSTTVTEAVITAYGVDVESKTFTINFVANEEELPMETEFELTRVKSTQGTFNIKIKNVIGRGLTAKSPSFKIKPVDIVYRTDNVAIATFQLSDAITEPVNTVVNFYRDGKIVLVAPVEIQLPKPKEPFGCDKLMLQGYVTSTVKPNGISVSIPFLNKERDFVVRAEPEAFGKKITVTQLANRLVIKADEPCKGKILLEHPDYITSTVDIEFIEYDANGQIIVEDKDGLIREAEALGLEYKNDMNVRYDPDQFIADVVSIRNITDKQKLGYIFVNGSVINRTSIRYFAAYEKNNSPLEAFQGPDAVARDNYNLYNVIKKTLHIADYYKFREEFLLIVQTFKTYKDTSLNLLRIYRFEERWKGSPQDLEKYKLITTFISKYIEQRGANMNQYVRVLRNLFPMFIVDNLDKFTNEEIYV